MNPFKRLRTIVELTAVAFNALHIYLTDNQAIQVWENEGGSYE